MCEVKDVTIEPEGHIPLKDTEPLFEVRLITEGGKHQKRIFWHKHAMKTVRLKGVQMRRADVFADDLMKARGVKMRIWARDRPEVLERRLELLAARKPLVAYCLSKKLASENIIESEHEPPHSGKGLLD